MTASPKHAVVCRPDGTRIAYDVVGDGPPVLFVHGMTSSRQRWDPVTDLLTPDFTCVRVDLRGLYRAKTQCHAHDLQVRPPAGPGMITRWSHTCST